MKSLIVEDDPISCRLAEEILDKHGPVVSVQNGPDALKAFQEATDSHTPFDLICLDIMMPDMNGHEVLKAIRQMETDAGIAREDQVKVIMTTALDDSENVLRAYTGYCAAYCVKPIDVTEFYNHLEKLRLI